MRPNAMVGTVRTFDDRTVFTNRTNGPMGLSL
jgi:hypothetical protein